MKTWIGRVAVAIGASIVLGGAPLAEASPRKLFDSEVILTPSAGDRNFGQLVAVDGKTVAVSDLFRADGGVYIFRRESRDWVQDARFPLFISSIAVQGNTVAAGAISNGGNGPGEVHIFVRKAGDWTEEAVIPVPADHVGPPASRQFFGVAVSLSENTLAVGDIGDETNGAFSGAVYIFTRQAGVWTERAKITSPNATTNEVFGDALALDHNRLLVGAPGGDFAEVYTGSRSNWTLDAHFAPPEAFGGVFGISVDISGSDAVVGSLFTNTAYVFRDAGRAWQTAAVLTGSDTEPGDQFGASVSISGNTILVGAPLADAAGTNSGAAYVFDRTGQKWTELQKLVGSDTGAEDNYGIGVAVSRQTAVIGRKRNLDSQSPEAYVYTTNSRGGDE